MLKPLTNKRWHGSFQFEYKQLICNPSEMQFDVHELMPLAIISPQIWKIKISKIFIKSRKIKSFWQQDYLFPDIFIPIFFTFLPDIYFILKKLESIFHSIFHKKFTILKTKLMSKFSLKWNLFRYLSWWQYWNARISFKKKNSRGFLIACWAIQVEMEFFFRPGLFICCHLLPVKPTFGDNHSCRPPQRWL